MPSNMLTEFVENAKSLPALPAVVSRLLKLLNDPDTTAEGIEHLMLADQSLSLRMLRLANSVFYGMSCQVASVRRAVVVLGFKTVRSMALAIWTQSLQDRARSKLEKHLHRQMFLHSLATAVASSTLAERVSFNLSEDAFVAGLLHDIGRTALISETGEGYDTAVLGRARSTQEGVAAVEQQLFGFDHAELGGHLLESFRLPPVLSEIARGHLTAEVDLTANPVLACVCLGNRVAAEMDLRVFTTPLPPAYNAIRSALGFDDPTVAHAIAERCKQRFSQYLQDLAPK